MQAAVNILWAIALLLLLRQIARTNGQEVGKFGRPAFEYLKHFGLEKVWDDAGSGGRVQGSFWRPINVPQGYHYVGHYARAGREISPGMDYIQLLGELDPDMAALKAPKELVWVYDDSKSGAQLDLTVVRAVPHDGYTCIGLLAFPMHQMPRVEDFPGYACVKTEYVMSTKVHGQIWNDGGSGAEHDFSAWGIAETYWGKGLYTGAFVGHNSQAEYTGEVHAVRDNAARDARYGC